MTLTVGIIIFIIFDTAIMAVVVVAVVRATFTPLHEQHPPREPRPDAVARNFQSFRFGLVSMGGVIHVSVDEEHETAR